MPGFKRSPLVLLVVTLSAGCDNHLLAPTQPLSRTELVARSAAAPTLTTSALSLTEIRLSWVDNVKNETGWSIEQKLGNDFQAVASVGTNATQHVASGLTSNTTYCYRVRAFKRVAQRTTYEPYSNPSCATTPAMPGPVDLSAKPLDGVHWARTVRITWRNAPTSPTGLLVETASGPAGPWTAAADLAPYHTEWTTSGVPEEQHLCYRVLARYANALSTPSNVDCTSFPAAPTGLSATFSGAMHLAWIDNSGVEDAYIVERSSGPVAGSIAFAPLASLPAGTMTYVDLTTGSDTAYWYRVWAVREGSRASLSNTIIAGILTKAPTAPAINAYPSSSSVMEIEASPTSPDQQGFRFERSADGTSGWTTIGTNTNPALSDVGRTTEERACYRVFAFNAVGESPASAVDCATPPAAPTELSITSPDVFVFHITWRDNSNVEDGYEVYFPVEVCDATGCWEEMQAIPLPPNTTEYITTDWRFIGVRAVKDGGYSDWGTSVASAASRFTEPPVYGDSGRARHAGERRKPEQGRRALPERRAWWIQRPIR